MKNDEMTNDLNNSPCQLVLNRDGRPSGFGRVQFRYPEAARACRDDLHMKVMEVSGNERADRDRGERYVEIFLYSERPNKLRFKKAVGEGVENCHEEDAEALGITKQHVLEECRQHMSMPGKAELLLSMLGVALSPGSRLYLKKTDQGLKHFLASYPNEFLVDGSKGRELITYVPAKAEAPQKSERLKQWEPIEPKEEPSQLAGLPDLTARFAKVSATLTVPPPESPRATQPSKVVSPMPTLGSNCGNLGTRRSSDSAGPISGNISDLGGFPPTPQIDDMVAVPAPESPKATFASADDTPCCSNFVRTPSNWGTPALEHPHRHHVLGDLDFGIGGNGGNGGTGLAPHTSAGPTEPALAQSWQTWGIAPSAPFWPGAPMFPNANGASGQDPMQSLMALGRPNPGMPGSSESAAAGLAMFGNLMMNPGPWPMAWMPEAPSQPAAQESDIFQKLLLNHEIPMSGQQPQPQPKAQLDISQAPALIRLRGLPFEANEQEILAWMSKYDVSDKVMECKQAVRLYNKPNGKPMGIAVVAINSPEEAEVVLQTLHGKNMRNRYIEVFHHAEGDGGVDKAYVQTPGSGTTGGTGNGAQAKMDSRMEASYLDPAGDTGGSGSGVGMHGAKERQSSTGRAPARTT
ncbi:unnamed protein product [Effrenium voratum]|nr:unnamed protein product [Effrenium voratum]